MFTVFVSESFIKYIFSEYVENATHIDSFRYQFLPSLNISELVCDFNLHNDEYNYIRIFKKSVLKDGTPFKLSITEKPIEWILEKDINIIENFPGSLLQKVFLVHLPFELIFKNVTLSNLNLISSHALDQTFCRFCIDGQLENNISTEQYFNHKKSFNPFYCDLCKVVMIDDSYLLAKRNEMVKDGNIVMPFYKKQISQILNHFIEKEIIGDKTIVFFLPTFEYDTKKPSWTASEKEELCKMIVEITKYRIPGVSCKVYFHDLKTHSRKVLTNTHFYHLDRGFEFIYLYEKDPEGLKQMVEGIGFKSIFLRNKLLGSYIKDRLAASQTGALAELY